MLDRRQHLSYPLSNGGPLENKERHIGAKFHPDLHQLPVRNPQSQEFINSHQYRRAITAATAKPRRNRNMLSNANIEAGLHTAMPQQCISSTPCNIFRPIGDTDTPT